MNCTPQSIDCFVDGLAYVKIPITLTLPGGEPKDIQKGELILTHLPETVVEGSLSIEPQNTEAIEIVSISKTTQGFVANRIGPSPGKWSQGSMVASLRSNIGNPGKFRLKDGCIARGRIGSVDGESLTLEKEMDPSEASETPSIIILKIDQILIADVALRDRSRFARSTLSVTFKGVGEEQSTHHQALLTYLLKGVGWRPSYTLKLDCNSSTLKIVPRACVQSNVDLIQSCPVPELNLMMGNPYGITEQGIDPLVHPSPTSTLTKGHPSNRGAHNQNKNSSSMAPIALREGRTSNVEHGNDSKIGIGKTEHRGRQPARNFSYTVQNVTMKKGQPTYMALCAPLTDIPYHNHYRMTFGQKTVGLNTRIEAIHEIRFKNQYPMPLVGAPALICAATGSSTEYLGRDSMDHTDPGGTAVVRTSRVTGISGTLRSKPTVCYRDGACSASTSDLTIEISNAMHCRARCQVDFDFSGSITNAQPKAASLMQKAIWGTNATSSSVTCSWDVCVPANGSLVISFTAHKYCTHGSMGVTKPGRRCVTETTN